MPEGSRVGLARLGGAGTDPSLEVPVRCHLAFHALARNPPAIPPEAADQDERSETGSPFAFSAGPGWGRSTKVRRGPRRANILPNPARIVKPPRGSDGQEVVPSGGPSRYVARLRDGGGPDYLLSF